jgi:RNA polymerase sigma-70 factor (ECF subfamily)
VAPNDSELEPEIVEAVRYVRAGNAQAYAAIVTRFQGPILTLCAAILRNGQAAEELAQDVFVRAYQQLDTFDVRRPMKPWLVKIAYRLAQQKCRTQGRRLARERAAATTLEQNGGDEGPTERLIADERSDLLWQAVYALPMAERTAVVLYYREDMSVKETAAVMGVSPGTVKTHLFRARSQIEINLRAKGFDEGDIP